MAKKEDPYDQPYVVTKLNLLFAISSVILVITVLAMVWDDYEREWKGFQRNFFQIERTKAQAAVEQAQKAIDKEKSKALQQQLEAAKAKLEQQHNDFSQTREELDNLNAELFKVTQQYQFSKSIYDSVKYNFESATAGHSSDGHDAEEEKSALEEAKADLDKWDSALQDITLRRKLQKSKVDAFESEESRLKAESKELLSQVNRVERRLSAVSQSKVVEFFLNAPLLDFMRPTLKIKQVVLNKLRNNINFMDVPRVDRCQTCHMGIDRSGYEDVAQPFKSHPRPKIFVGPSSSHPIESFGCTPCHNGRDRGTSFVSSAHTPDGQKQREDWEKRLGWHELDHWEHNMFARSHFESACYICHMDQVTKPGAPKLNKALTLIERSGCFGCHKIAGFEGLRKVGPDLKRIADKLTPEWTYKWVKNPRAFNAHSRMPRFFDLSNTSTPELLARNNVEAFTIVEYLFSQSERGPLSLKMPRLQGNAARGQELVQDLGCLGCHVAPGEKAVEDRTSYRRFGPVLVSLGSKTTRTWIYNWIKNPKAYFPDTLMPNLRLSDQEAVDIVAYLSAQKNPQFDSETVPPLNKEIRDDIAIEHLLRSLTLKEAKDKLATMDEAARNNYVGEKLISRYGCFGCHTIKGFEHTLQIGTELSNEGNKNPGRLDFGYLDLERKLPVWLRQKFLNPRAFDEGLVKRPEEKLKMPNFNFTEEDADLLITAILSFRDDRVDSTMKRNLSPREVAVEEGRRLIHKRNCQGCHILEGRGGEIRTTMEDIGFAPPPLDGEGRKVQSDWLHKFLKAPSTIRPWLKVRMPTFGFTNREVTTLVRSFAFKDEQDFPYETFDFSTTAERLRVGKRLFDMLRCMQCHIVGPIPAGRNAADMAPDLRLARSRLKPQWIIDWLKDPQTLQEGTRMPTFFLEGSSPVQDIFDGDANRQIEAIRDHVLSLARR